MSTSSGLPQSSPIPDPNVPPPTSPAFSQPAATQIIPGTTVIGTGVTGDVWSYTIPPITSLIVPSEPVTLPPSSNSAPISTPEPSGTFVATELILSGTTVVGGTETGVPWSYTIPAQSIVTSVFVPITISPTTVPSESFSLTDSLIPSTETPAPTTPSLPGYTEPVPRPPPDSSRSTLSGVIVAATLVGLLLLMFGVAGCLYLRLRRRQREFEGAWEHVHVEKDIGAVWGRAWGSEDKGGAWRKRQKMNNQEYGGDGYKMSMGSEAGGALPAAVARFRQGNHTPGNESAERLIERPVRDGGPSSSYPSTRPNTTPINSSITYPVNARYPQTRGSDKIPDRNTRAPLSYPIQRNVNTTTNDDTNHKEPTSSKSPTGKLRRLVPPPSPYVYAPPQEATPQPAPQVSYSTNPFSTRPTSPYRASSPYGSHTSQGRKVLSKQRVPVLPPSTSAFMRHMLPARTMSLRRPKAGSNAPPAPAPSSSPTTSPARPGLNSLPSFIRDRRFSPGTSRNGSKSTSHGGGESVIFSPSPRPAAQLPSHAPTRVSSPVLQSVPLSPPRLVNTRDRYLSPPHPHGGRDRSSQLTSTTRSGGTGRSRDTRSTGRSGGSAVSGRSGESRLTGRSGDARFANRSRVLAQIPEGEPEPGVGRRHDRPRRHEGP
ncbi:transmembrane protein, putative [Rhizoctonia solani AG-3 Rhs1AP]|uniref:Transmembrane protein, putative n=1 Tax=Rhizoctonia solani AG-3 Rhs1AP TaxID=1086054 RepID=A0A0A1UII2_9AGAM|nr:transmembrane protein, putative [Rhizoctonia solani AG-3 Rhs1AP]